MYDAFDYYADDGIKVVSHNVEEPLFPDVIQVSVNVDISTYLFPTTTDEQDTAIRAAMLRAARGLERDVAAILEYEAPENSDA